MKKKCECGNTAVWVDSDSYVCDDCVMPEDDKLGFSDNWNYAKPQEGLPIDLPEGIEGKDWAWVEYEGDEYVDKITKDDGYWQYLDERGRPYPSPEYYYSVDGFDE